VCFPFGSKDLGIFPDIRAEGNCLSLTEAASTGRGATTTTPTVLLIGAAERQYMIFPMAANRQRDILAGLEKRWARFLAIERPLNQ